MVLVKEKEDVCIPSAEISKAPDRAGLTSLMERPPATILVLY